MEFLQRSWAQVWAQLARLSFAERALILALVVILLGVLGAAMFLVATPQKVAVPYANGRLDAGVAMLKRMGMNASVEGGQLMVPASRQYDAIAMLTEHDMLSDNGVQAFASLVEHSPWETNAQLKSKYYTALQVYLSDVAGRIKGIRKASVIISPPENKGFGAGALRPTASVLIELEASRTQVGKELVRAVASLVSGAVAEMTPRDVQIVDHLGYSHNVGDPDDRAPAEAVELARSHEDRFNKQINQFLRIRDAIVAVRVETSAVHKEVRDETEWMPGDAPLKSETKSEVVSTKPSRAAEAGVRPNTGADITTAGSVGEQHTETSSDTQFAATLPRARVQKQIVGHQVERISVTINVPRNYFVQIYKARGGGAEAKPPGGAEETSGGGGGGSRMTRRLGRSWTPSWRPSGPRSSRWSRWSMPTA